MACGVDYEHSFNDESDILSLHPDDYVFDADIVLEDEVIIQNKLELTDEITALKSIYMNDIMAFESERPVHISISISVILKKGFVKVNAWELIYQGMTMNNYQLSGKNRPELLERSLSNDHELYSYRLNHLTPLNLHVVFPPSYPSNTAPKFTLSCLWLNKDQLASLCKELDSIWNQYQSLPVIFSWVDWLQNNTLLHLDINDVFDLPNCDNACFCDDNRAIPEYCNTEKDLFLLLEYDRFKVAEEFRSSMHDCNICCIEKLGHEFYLIPNCDHYVCKECMSEYCSMHVSDGTVRMLVCPDHECDELIPPFIIFDVLGPDALERWEKLNLNHALDTMGDVIWCPRCNNAATADSQDLGFCHVCMFSFCVKCNDTWHSNQSCISLETKLKDLKSGKDKMSKAQKLKQEQDIKMQILNTALLKSISKPCPHCGVNIEKHAGCNKVTCTMCSKCMCWICGLKINSYAHFQQTSCNTFDDFIPWLGANHLLNRPVVIQQQLVNAATADASIMSCKRCKMRCLKENKNNHIKCWHCKTNLCYVCKQIIVGSLSEHFKVYNPCTQHS